MANNKGFPSNPSQLTSAVRKALFTSATVTAIAVGAPGHNAYAQQVGACNPIETEFTSGTVQCSGEFDASINYEVKDFTVVDGNEVPNDITVVVAEGSTASGISIAAMPVNDSSEPAEGSIVIESHGDVTQAAGSELSIDPEFEKTYYDRAIRDGQLNGVVWTGTSGLEDGSTWKEDPTKRTYFEGSMSNEEVVAFLAEQGVDAGLVEESLDAGGATDREEQLTVVVAPEGTFEFEDVAGISAETDSGSIDIVNSGNVSMGDGLSITYYTRASTVDTNPDYPIKFAIDTDEDGIRETIVLGEVSQVFVSGENEASASVVGIDAESVSGGIHIDNQGAIEAGDISYGVRAQTETGDINLVNSGDIATGDASTGISASSAVNAELAVNYGGITSETYYVAPNRGNPGFYVNETISSDVNIYRADGSENRIAIANSGLISVGGDSVGIHAHNPSGDSIAIDNSGDITVVSGEGSMGIYADAIANIETEYSNVSCVPGSFFNPCPLYVGDNGSYYADKQVTINASAGVEDLGDIVITNSGVVDLTAASDSAGIHARTLGYTAIENSGEILVGENSNAISTEGAGETRVINSGDIQLQGGGSNAVNVSAYILNPSVATNDGISNSEIFGTFTNEGVREAYAGFGGDVSVYNTGSISGDSVIADLVEYNEAGAFVSNPNLERNRGISVSSTGSNLKGVEVRWASYGADSWEAFREDETASDVFDEMGIEFFDTTVVNTGDIALGDLSEGIRVSATYGEATVINSGSVSVGNGFIGESAGSYGAFRSYSAGIIAAAQGDNWSNNTVINTADGVVTGGDISQGLVANSQHGDAVVLNDGSVTVGSGDTIEAGDTRDTDWSVLSTGIRATTVLGLDAYTAAVNNGSVTTGDKSFGMLVNNATGPGFFTEAFDHNYTAAAFNTGVISSGDNSAGIAISGGSNFAQNSGDITIGSGPVSSASYVIDSAAMMNLGGIEANLYSVLLNEGSITTGDTTSGIDASAFAMSVAVQGENGQIVTGDDTYGMRSIGYIQGVTQNAGSIETGDNSTGMRTYAIFSQAVNSGDVVVGENSTGMSVVGASSYARNSGTISTGDNSTGIQVFSGAAPAVVANFGNVTTGDNGVALEVIGQDYLDQETGQVIANQVFNGGNITGSIITGDSDDVLRNGFRYDNSGNIAGVGKITLNDAVIDMGAGRNTFINEAGDIVFSGDSLIELGSQGTMVNYSGGANYVTISSLDDEVGDTLTINGDVTFANIQSTGSLFMVDVSSTVSDSIVINGDLNAVDVLNQAGDTQPSDLRVAMNVTDQSKGAQTTDAILTVNGEQNVDSVSLAALGGDFADTILEAEMQQDGNGNWVIAYTAGLSDLGAAASSVSHLAESFWTRSASAFFDSERAANVGESSRVEGLHAWSTVFHTDSDVESRGDVKGQDLAYSQLLSNHMAGATYNTKLGGTWLSISPMVGKGYADGNQLAQQSSAALDTETFALNGSLSMGDFYASAMYQQVDFDANVRAYDSAARTSGQAKGYSLEGGWTYLMESGIAMTSYAQWSDVKSEIDGFTSSDSNFDYAYNLGSTSTTRLGLSMRKSFKLADGFAMPYATFSVADSSNHNAHDLHANGVVFNSDVSGSGFNLDFGVDGKYKLWTIKTGLGVHSGDTDKNGLSGHFAISRSL